MINKRLLAYCALIATTIFWGGLYLVKAELLKQFNQYHVVFFNTALPAIALLCYAVIKKEKLFLHKKEILPVILSGLLGIFATQFFSVVGIERTSGVTASVFFSMVPAMFIISNLILYKKHVNLSEIISIVISIVGVLFVIYAPNSGSIDLLGCVFLFLGNVCWIAYVYFCNANKFNMSDNLQLFYRFASAGVLCLGFLFLHPLDYVKFASVEVVSYLLFTAILSGCIAYSCFTFSVKILGAIKSSIILNSIPIVALLLNIIIFGGEISPLQIFGIILVFISLIIPLLKIKSS